MEVSRNSCSAANPLLHESVAAGATFSQAAVRSGTSEAAVSVVSVMPGPTPSLPTASSDHDPKRRRTTGSPVASTENRANDFPVRWLAPAAHFGLAGAQPGGPRGLGWLDPARMSFPSPYPGREMAILYANGRLLLDLVSQYCSEGGPLIKRVIELQSGSAVYSGFLRCARYRGEIVLHDRNPLVSMMQHQILKHPQRVAKHIQEILDHVRAICAHHEMAIDDRFTFHRLRGNHDPALVNCTREIRHYLKTSLTSCCYVEQGFAADSASTAQTDERHAQQAALMYILHKHTSHGRETAFRAQPHRLFLNIRVNSRTGFGPSGDLHCVFGKALQPATIWPYLQAMSELFTSSNDPSAQAELRTDVCAGTLDTPLGDGRAGDLFLLEVPTTARDTFILSETLVNAVLAAWKQGARLLIVSRMADAEVRNKLMKLGLALSAPPARSNDSLVVGPYLLGMNFVPTGDGDFPLLPLPSSSRRTPAL
jgi:hypothetical protein